MQCVPEIISDAPSYGWIGRAGMAKLQAGACSSPPIVVTGDSRAACFPYNSICGIPAINAGMPGIRVHDAANFCAQAAANAPGSPLTVLFIGINNAWLYPNDPEMATFAADYSALIANFQSLGRKLIATTPWPLEKGFPAAGPDSSIVTWSQNAAVISEQILAICYQAGVPCVDLNGQMRQADLTLLPGLSQDAVHPNARGAAAVLNGISPVVQYFLNH